MAEKNETIVEEYEEFNTEDIELKGEKKDTENLELKEDIDNNIDNEEKKEQKDQEDDKDTEIVIPVDTLIEDPQDKNKQDNSGVAKGLYNLLKEEGLFVEDENVKIEGFSDLIGEFKNLGDSAVSEYRQNLPKEMQEYLEAYEQGLDINRIKTGKNKIRNYKEYTTDFLSKREDIAKGLISEKLKGEGMTDEKIEIRLNLYSDSGLLVEEAERIRDIKIANEESRIEAENANEKKRLEDIRKKDEEWRESMTTIIDKTGEILGRKLTKKDRKELEKITFNAVEIRNVNDREVPISFLQKALEDDPSILIHLNYMISNGLVGKKANSSLLEETYRSKHIEQIEKAMRGEVISGTSGKSPDYSKSLESSMKSLNDVFKNLRV